MLSSDKAELIELSEYSIKTENYILTLPSQNEQSLSNPNTSSESNTMDLNEFITINNTAIDKANPESVIIPDISLSTNEKVSDNMPDCSCPITDATTIDTVNADTNPNSLTSATKSNVHSTVAKKKSAAKGKLTSATQTRRKKTKKSTNVEVPVDSSNSKQSASILKTNKLVAVRRDKQIVSNTCGADGVADSDNDSEISVYFNDDEVIDLNEDNIDEAEEQFTKSGEDASLIDEVKQNLKIVYEIHESFVGFPKTIIKDTKLLIRGKPLLDLMSR